MQPSLFAARVDGLLAQVGTFLGDLVQAPSGDGHQLLDQQLHQFWHSFYELKKRSHDDELSVAVLALAKSGKPEDSRRSRCCPPRIAQGNARGEGLACNEGNARGPAARGAAVKRARSAHAGLAPGPCCSAQPQQAPRPGRVQRGTHYAARATL